MVQVQRLMAERRIRALLSYLFSGDLMEATKTLGRVWGILVYNLM